MSDEEVSDVVEDRQCPFCLSKDACEHLLLLVDRTFRVVDGGILMRSFRDHWDKLFEEGAETFDESECFDDLLDSIDGLSDYSREFDEEGGPGMSSSYSIYYVAASQKAERALSHFAGWSAA